MTTVSPTTTELAQNVIASASSMTSGSGTSASSASAEASSKASGQTIARRSSSGQNARSRWYMPGWVILRPRTRTPSSVASALRPSSSVRGP